MKIVETSVDLLTPGVEIIRQIETIERIARVCTGTVPSSFINWDLILRMFKDQHLSVFYHTLITYEITCPLCITKQIMRHQVGTPTTEYTEMSLRYVNVAKGEDGVKFHAPKGIMETDESFLAMCEEQERQYKELMQRHIPPQSARCALGQYVSTRVVKSFNLPSLKKFLDERLDKRAQPEVRDVATLMRDILPKEVKKIFGFSDYSS